MMVSLSPKQTMITAASILGPDIDTPEKEKTGLQELLSGLNLGSTRPSRSSAPIPAQRQMNDAVIQCEIKSGSSTTSNELTLSGNNNPGPVGWSLCNWVVSS